MPATLNEHQRILLETTAARDQAEALLRGLVDAKAVSERHMASLNKRDPMKQVTGKSSLDNAITSTQRMIESLNRAIEQVKRDLSEEDLALLDEVGAN